MIFKKIMVSLFNVVKSKLFRIIFVLVLIAIILLLLFKLDKNSKTIDKLNNNNVALQQGIKTYQTKNGELFNMVQSLQFSQKEFKKENKELYDKLKSMGIKPKNTQSISELEYSYNNRIKKLLTINKNHKSDSIRLQRIIDSLRFSGVISNNDNYTIPQKYVLSFNDNNKYYDISGNVNLSYNLRNSNGVSEKLLTNELPYLTDINFSIKDTLLVVPTINYKRVWLFFRKPYSVNVFIKSENPAFKLEQVKTYQIK